MTEKYFRNLVCRSETGKKPIVRERVTHLAYLVPGKAHRVVLNRLNRYMGDKELFPHTMIGFRPKLSTEDVMLRLKHQIIDGDGCSPLDTRAILGLNLNKAFDNLRHEAVLENLEKN